MEITLVGVVTDETVRGLLQRLEARFSLLRDKLVLIEMSHRHLPELPPPRARVLSPRR